MPQKVKFHGATIDGSVIQQYYPCNPTKFPKSQNFGYFLFHHVEDAGDEYHLKASAYKNDNTLIEEIQILKETSTVPIDFTSWTPADLKITTVHQLDTLDVTGSGEIEWIKLKAKKYDKHYVCYEVTIKIGDELTDLTKTINPSPPATDEENNWSLQP